MAIKRLKRVYSMGFLTTVFPTNEKINEMIDAINDLTDGSITTASLTLTGNLHVMGNSDFDGNVNIDGVLTLGQPIVYSNQTSITAFAGGGQVGATQLTEEQNNVTVVATDGDSVKLPTAVAGLSIKIKNNGAQDLAVFPFLGDLIDGGAVNASVTLAPEETCTFLGISTSAWESDCLDIYTDASLTGSGTSSNPLSVAGGGGLSAFAMFYGLTAGTGMGGTDYAATVAAGAPVPFPQDGPALGGIVSTTNTTFTIPAIGTYEVTFRVHTTEPGQLQLTLDGTVLEETTAVNMNPTAGGHPIIGNAIIATTLINQVLSVINPAGNSTALTITPADGANTHANSQSLVIKRLA